MTERERMNLIVKKFLGVFLLASVLLLSSSVLAQEQPQSNQTPEAKPAPPAAEPNLADIIPLEADLTGRLATLKIEIAGLLEVSTAKRNYTGIEENLKKYADKLQLLKDSKDYKYTKLVRFRETIKQESELFEEINKPLSKAINQLAARRKEWRAEKKRWNELQSSILGEEKLDQLKTTFQEAHDTIDTALNLILAQLQGLLKLQETEGSIQEKITALTTELDGLIVYRVTDSPFMFSSKYFSQFTSSRLWFATRKGLEEITWPGSQFLAQKGLMILIQVFLVFYIGIVFYRNRQVLSQSKRWQFLAARPFSAGLFLVTTMIVYVNRLQGMPNTFEEIGQLLIVAASFFRISGVLIFTSWKRQFVYWLIIVFVITRLIDLINVPLPLFRLYLVLTSLVSLVFFLRWAGKSKHHKDPAFYARSLRLSSLFFVIFIIAQVLGKEKLAEYLFVSSLRSTAILFVFAMITYLIRGGLEWLLHRSSLSRATMLSSNADAIISQVTIFIYFIIWGLVVLPGILIIWGFYTTLPEATFGLLTLGFNIESQRISIGLVLTSAGILYGSFLLSWILQKLLMDQVLITRRVEMGVRHSIGRLVHYVFIVIGFLLALSILGFSITNLTIILSALGVGIGFGLQGAVNNFICGLILLFERPVRVGDMVVLNGIWAEIKSIGLRSTTLQSFDSSDVIIPNADLISNPVINWELSNRRRRIDVPVGVAYGSDVSLVIETLIACTRGNTMLTETPAPQVLFLRFGESSLDFELRVFVSDVRNSMTVISELHQEIDRRFREAKIEIAFPQRDLHLRSLDETISLRSPETAK